MTSFDVAVEPAPQPRLAAIALAVHACAAASPWLARMEFAAAIAVSALAAAGFGATLARIPGRHCRLAALYFEGGRCRARLAGQTALVAANPVPGARAYASLIALEVEVGGRRLGWLLARGAIPDADFRRLKVRIRLTC